MHIVHLPTCWRRLYCTLISVILALCMVLTSIAAANACVFDFRKPERTEIDWILQAGALVLARPNPDAEFSFEVIQVLRGNGQDFTWPFLVSSTDRRKLQRNSEHAVLFRRTEAGNWTRVSYVDTAFREILKKTIKNTNLWNSVDFHPSRFAFFEALQTSTNPKLRDLAVRELDKASYKELRALNVKISTDELLADLQTKAGYPYQAIRVLLLGFSGDDKAKVEILSYLERMKNRADAQNIGAYSAALIELYGVEGIHYLNENLLTDANQPTSKLQGIISALAAHHDTTDYEVSNTINETISELLQSRPQTASIVAQQFSTFTNWSQAEPLAQLVKKRQLTTPVDLLTVSVYLAQARRYADAE
jgi:hypothetical protein